MEEKYVPLDGKPYENSELLMDAQKTYQRPRHQSITTVTLSLMILLLLVANLVQSFYLVRYNSYSFPSDYKINRKFLLSR